MTELGEPDGAHLGTVPVESILAVHTVRRALYVAPPIVVVAWLLRGQEGAVASMVGVGLIVVNFLLSGWIMSRALRISLAMYQIAALVGFVVRLGLITLTMTVVAQLFDIDRLAFGLAAVLAYMVLLGLEAVAVARGNERELNWVS